MNFETCAYEFETPVVVARLVNAQIFLCIPVVLEVIRVRTPIVMGVLYVNLYVIVILHLQLLCSSKFIHTYI